jgi:hypothetical protein
MLLDADATAYADVYEASLLGTDCNVSSTAYDAFEYKLPNNADPSCTSTNIVSNSSLTMQIPAGTYDFLITNPTPDDRIWVAAGYGNIGGRQDNYVFEPGKTYEFHVYSGSNGYDATDVTISNPTTGWTLVEGVSNPYTLGNLNPETTYQWQVQGVNCEGNGNNTEWSEIAEFETGAEQFTVYFNAGNGSCPKDTMFRSAAFDLPAATSSCGDYSLAGWASSPVNAAASAPALFTETFTPTKDTVLYAVYVNTSRTEWSSFPVCSASSMSIPYFNDFESETPDYVVGSYGNGRTYTKPAGWTIVSQDPQTTRRARPQVFHTASYAHSGSFSLRLDSASVFAMPRLDDDVNVSGLLMELYVRQPYADQYLEVGVMTDLSGEFTSLATINNPAATVEHWLVDFSNAPANAHYIAFRNSGPNNRSINNIDDIHIYYNNDNPCEILADQIEYSENFDNIDGLAATTSDRTGVEPDCWTVAYQYEKLTATSKPQVFRTASYAHSGNFSLRLEGQCIYAMPKFADNIDLNSLSMELFVRQPYAHDQLEVGYMTDINDPTSFVSVLTVNNGSNGVERKLADFSEVPSNAHFIAFRNRRADNAAGRCINNIDDIRVFSSADDGCAIALADLPYSQNFDAITDISSTDRTGVEPDCWTVAYQYEKLTATSKPQVFYTRPYAHSGHYSLRMEGQCIYAMPRLDNDINLANLSMELYVRQPYDYDQLEVGYMTDLNDPNSFIPVGEPINTTPKAVEMFSVNFAGAPASAHFIAFRNSKVDGGSGRSICNIDDISIFTTGTRSESAHNNAFSADGGFGYDDELEEVTAPLGVDELGIDDFSVWPNPTTGLLTLAAEAQRVEIVSLMGQRVAVFENTSSIDISDLPAGVYILKAVLPQGEAVRKIVKR